MIAPNARVKFVPTHDTAVYSVSLDISYWIANDEYIPNDIAVYSDEVLRASKY